MKFTKGTSLDDTSVSAEVDWRKAERDSERLKIKLLNAQTKVVTKKEAVKVATENANTANAELKAQQRLRDAAKEARRKREAEERAEKIAPLKVEADRYKAEISTMGKELKTMRTERSRVKKANNSVLASFQRAEKKQINETKRTIKKATAEAKQKRLECAKEFKEEKKRIYDEYMDQKNVDVKTAVAAAQDAAQEASWARKNPSKAYKTKYEDMMDELEAAREQDEDDQLEDAQKDFDTKMEEIKEEEELTIKTAELLRDDAMAETREARENYKQEQEERQEEIKRLTEEIDRVDKDYKALKKEASITFKELNALLKEEKAAVNEHKKDTADERKAEQRANKCAKIEAKARRELEAAIKKFESIDADSRKAEELVQKRRRTLDAVQTTNANQPSSRRQVTPNKSKQ